MIAGSVAALLDPAYGVIAKSKHRTPDVDVGRIKRSGSGRGGEIGHRRRVRRCAP